MKNHIKIILFIVAVLLFFTVKGISNFKFHSSSLSEKFNITSNTPIVQKTESSLWEECGLEGIVSEELFQMALNGQRKIQDLRNSNILTIIDFTKASTEKRAYVIDLKSKKLLYHTWVAHGKNSGENFATSFSNTPQSKASSLGFYTTAEIYEGKHGLSLRLDGLEEGINHLARERAIVIHGANYVNPEFIQTQGRLGRSWGCPAFSNELSKEIITTIAGGTCLFIYSDVDSYVKNSSFIDPS